MLAHDLPACATKVAWVWLIGHDLIAGAEQIIDGYAVNARERAVGVQAAGAYYGGAVAGPAVPSTI